MASAGPTVADVVPQLYFCHKCRHNVTVRVAPNTDPLCPTCNDGFLEEVEHPQPNPIPNPFSDPFTSFLGSFPIIFANSRFPISNSPNPRSSANSVPSGQTTRTRNNPREPPAFDPFTFLREHINSLREGGANIPLVFENQPSGGLPPNLGDYFLGQGLEQLIQQLAENDPNRYGTPPASKSAVEALPDVTVDEKLLSSDLAQCAVCQDDFEKGMVVKQMPCKHAYHSECLLPWLELHNSCPVCRYELPTDDPDYENRARGNTASGGNAASGGNGSSANVRYGFLGSGTDTGEDEESGQIQGIVERTFSILLRPLRGSREDNNVGGNNDGNSGSGGQQNRDSI